MIPQGRGGGGRYPADDSGSGFSALQSHLRTGQVNFEPAPEGVVRVDPADQYFEAAMKKLPPNAPEADVLEIIKTAAKG